MPPTLPRSLRRLTGALGASLLAACSVSTQSLPLEDPVAITDDAILPAGLYFRHGYLAPRAAGAPPARFAVLHGVFATPAAAEQAVAAIPGLAPGYPMVVHTDELGLTDPSVQGVAVVAGLYADPAAAAQAATGPGLSVAPLLDADAAHRRAIGLGDAADPTAPRLQAVRLRPGGSPAYARAAIEAAEEAHFNYADVPGPDPLASPPEPLCHLDGGRVFLATGADHALDPYRWAAVDCDGQPAYVPRERTLLGTLFLPLATGGARVVQVARVECDTASFRHWTEPPQAPPTPPRLELARCGAADEH